MEEVSQANPVASNQRPINQLKTNRSLVKFIFLGLITLTIYDLVFYAGISQNLNIIASRYDGKKTMNFWLLFFIVGPVTLEIGAIVWMHKLCARMGDEIKRRGLDFSFDASTFWLWGVLGSLIVVGPFIFIYKLAKASNLLAENFNING